MSLLIDVDRVVKVLLPDGWHTVESSSFNLDAYEFRHKKTELKHDGENTGFKFFDEGTQAWIVGPLSSVWAFEEYEPLATRLRPA